MKKLDYTIVFVSDMDRSVAFYRDVLGLPIRFSSPHWTECATQGCAVALHLAGVASRPLDFPTLAGHCQLGFHVPDLEAFHALMQAQHVTCLHLPEAQSFGKVAVYADPDGLAITIIESSAGE